MLPVQPGFGGQRHEVFRGGLAQLRFAHRGHMLHQQAAGDDLAIHHRAAQPDDRGHLL